MVSQTVIKLLNIVETELTKIKRLTEDQISAIQEIIAKQTKPNWSCRRSGYILFSMSERKRLKEAGELEGLAFGDVSRLLGKNWRGSSQEIKAKWNEQAGNLRQEDERLKIEARILLYNSSDDDSSDTEPDEPDEPVVTKQKRGRKPMAVYEEPVTKQFTNKQKRGRKPKKPVSDSD